MGGKYITCCKGKNKRDKQVMPSKHPRHRPEREIMVEVCFFLTPIKLLTKDTREETNSSIYIETTQREIKKEIGGKGGGYTGEEGQRYEISALAMRRMRAQW